MNKKIVIFFICISLHYKKKINVFIKYINYFFNEIIIINFFINYFFGTRKNIFRLPELNNFIAKNKEFWEKKYSFKKNENKKILVENFINQPAYTMSNAIIAVYLRNIFKYKIVGLLRKGDYVGKAIFNSYGIKDINYYQNLNILQRLKSVYLSLKLIKNSKDIDSFCKIKYKNLNVGLSSYDSYVRYTGQPSLKFINSELVYFLSDSIGACIFFNKFLNKKKIKLSVQAETAFSPPNNLFQSCLKKKIKVFSRLGTNNFSIRIYKKWKERYTYRANFDQKLFEKIYSNHRIHCVKKYEYFFKKEIKDGKFGFDVSVSDKIKKTKLINKKNIKKIFKWGDKKIAVVFLHHFIDGNFHSGPRKSFRDNYTWAKLTMNALPKIKNVNWIIKPHPSQYIYKSKDNLQKEIDDLANNNDHIKVFPKQFTQSSLLDIADFAITSHGTVAIEYLTRGTGTVFCDSSYYSNLRFMKMYKGQNNYLKILKNLDKIKRPTKNIMDRAKTFLYIRHHLVKSNCSLLSQHSITRGINKKKFWSQNVDRLKKFNFKNDELYKMFKIQLKLELVHSLNLNKLKIKNLYNLKVNKLIHD